MTGVVSHYQELTLTQRVRHFFTFTFTLRGGEFYFCRLEELGIETVSLFLVSRAGEEWRIELARCHSKERAQPKYLKDRSANIIASEKIQLIFFYI